LRRWSSASPCSFQVKVGLRSWVADHWDEIVTVCKWIVAILGIVVMIIGGPLAWLVVAAALLVLADTVMKYIQGKASLWDVLFAVLDCIPMTKGLTSLGKLAELYKAGGLLKIGAHALGSVKSALTRTASLIRSGGEGIRAINVAFKGSSRLEGGTIPFPGAVPEGQAVGEGAAGRPYRYWAWRGRHQSSLGTPEIPRSGARHCAGPCG
jgi:hypothetical protein